MTISDRIKNATVFANKYHTDSEAVVIACYFNPQNNPYRLKAFNIWYDAIKHLNHRILECVIGGAEPQLELSESISRVYTENLLWHKESLLNKIISDLPAKFKYVFWLDTDVLFTNKRWLTEGVKALKSRYAIIQPFEYCVHLRKDEMEPPFDMNAFTSWDPTLPNRVNNRVWRSFGANQSTTAKDSEDYNTHGHVGFAWGARRVILDKCPLYDKALIGGADHIIAHAAAKQVKSKCIIKGFTDNIEEVQEWMHNFAYVTQDGLGSIPGSLYHIWHGDIEKRQYLKRVQEFTPETKKITERDGNGLFVTKDDSYVKKYFREREVPPQDDNSFFNSMILGYATNSTAIGMMGGDPLGAMIGDALNMSEETKGVEFGGGGAGGSWDNNQNFS